VPKTCDLLKTQGGTEMYQKQQLLFPTNLAQYDAIFENLDLSAIKKLQQPTGRPSVSLKGICRLLIYKNLRSIKTLTELDTEVHNNPAIAYKCGFEKIPSRHRYEEFLHNLPNEVLQQVYRAQIRTLIKLGVITGKFLSIDATPVIANVKENNPKVFVEGKFNKTKFPKNDPDARLGVMLVQNAPKKSDKKEQKSKQLELFPSKKLKNKQIQFFWGYRNYTIFDSLSELPVCEITKQTNVGECKMFIPCFGHLKKYFKFDTNGVLADAAYDTEYIRKFIRKKLKAKDFIPINPRAAKQEIKFTNHNTRVCIAGFEMYSWGRFKDRGRLRQKHVCPITHLKWFAKIFSFCPMNHPKFATGGCYAYTRLDKSYRQSALTSKSPYFKKIYKLQSGSERGFSRLLELYMQHPTVTGINAVSNHCSLAHITVLAIAIAAVKTNNPKKIRFIKGLLKTLACRR
jgi:transposase